MSAFSNIPPQAVLPLGAAVEADAIVAVRPA